MGNTAQAINLDELARRYGGQMVNQPAALPPAPKSVTAAARESGRFDEQAFRTWYSGRAKMLGLHPDPDAPEHFYDYRAAFAAGAEPDQVGHWPSEFKHEGHPNRFVDGVDTITGRVVKNGPTGIVSRETETLPETSQTAAPAPSVNPAEVAARFGGRLEREPEPERGWLGKAWDAVNTGIVSAETMTRALTGHTPQEIEEELNILEDSPAKAALKTFVLGSLKSMGSVASSFTSPLSIATMGAGAATKMPGSAATVARAVTGGASVGFGAHGASQALSEGPEGETVPEEAERRIGGAAMAVGGAAGAMASGAPQSSLNATQRVVRRTGAAVAEVPKRFFPTRYLTAEDAITRAVRPINTNMEWKGALREALPDLKRAELASGSPIKADPQRPAAAIDQTLDLVSQAKRSVWAEYEARLGPNQQATIDGNWIAEAMERSIDRYTRLHEPKVVEQIKAKASNYRRQLTLVEAEDLLHSLNQREATYFAKNRIARRQAQGDPDVAAQVAEADALRKRIYLKLDQLTGSGAKDIKGRYRALLNVEKELYRRRNVVARQAPESLSEQLAGWYAIGEIASGGVPVKGIVSRAAARYIREVNSADSLLEGAFAKVPDPGPARIQSFVPAAARRMAGQPALQAGTPPAPGPIIAGPANIQNPPSPPPTVHPGTRATRLGLLLPEETGGNIPVGPVKTGVDFDALSASREVEVPRPQSRELRPERLLPERGEPTRLGPVPRMEALRAEIAIQQRKLRNLKERADRIERGDAERRRTESRSAMMSWLEDEIGISEGLWDTLPEKVQDKLRRDFSSRK